MITRALTILRVFWTICTCLTISCYVSPGQNTSTLAGTVIDSVTTNPIPLASITIAGTTFGASADSNGFYMIPGVPKGMQTVLCRHIAYDSTATTLAVPGDQDTVVLDITLSPRVLPLPGVTTLPRGPLHQIFREAFYTRWARVVFSAKQLEEEAIIEFDQFVRRRAPFAEGQYDLFVDGSSFPLDLRNIINIHDINQIFVWRRIDAPIELRMSRSRSPRERSAGLEPFIIKPYIIFIQTK